MSNGFDANKDLIDAWLGVSLEKRPAALELAQRARNATTLSTRQREILPEIIDHSLSALELLVAGWQKRQALWVGCGARSLYEASLVTSYVMRSSDDAERFYQDGLIDIRGIFESLHGQSLTLGDVPEFTKLITDLRNELSQVMASLKIPAKARHLGAAEIANQTGGEDDYKLVYSLLSKFSHSSSVAMLTRQGEAWLSVVLPTLAGIGLKSYMLVLACIAEACPLDTTGVPQS